VRHSVVNNEFEIYGNGSVVMRSFTSRHCRIPLTSSEDSASNEEKFKTGVSPYMKYEGWNFNSGNYLFTTDTK